MTKKKSTILTVLGLILLVVCCGVFFTIYAHYTINKPKFEVPEEVLSAKQSIPAQESEKYDYIVSSYNSAFCDETNITKSVDLSVDDNTVISDMSDADNASLKLIKGSLIDYTDLLYVQYDKLPGEKAHDFRNADSDDNDIISCEMTEGETDDKGNVTDDEYYFFTAELTAAANNDYNQKIIDGVIKKVSEMAYVTDYDISLKSYTVSGKIDKVRDKLCDISFDFVWSVDVKLDFKGDYSSLGKVNLSFECNVNESYTFVWYGAYFTSENVYMNISDENTLPVVVSVADDAEKTDYVLKFTSSDSESVEVDSDGIVTAEKVTSEPVTVTVLLKYKGHTYKSQCRVTVTDMEVVSNG